MLISKFYELLNKELISILENNSNDEKTKIHKNIEQNKGYALLIWFLNFYGKKEIYKTYITDGPDDKSCDIIFSSKDNDDKEIFYVVQSKFVSFTKKNESTYPLISKEEFGATLNDFSTILIGERIESSNKNFNKKYEDLKIHLENNGKIKFIFFTLAKFNDQIKDSIKSFNKKYSPNITLEVIDFDRVRRDYIEFKYKEITTNNPLEYTYNPEFSSIKLEIERFKDENRDILEFDGREKAYILLLKPKTLYDLFEKYKFSLFFKNVRNPLHKSNYNEQIVETLLRKPNAFWYFNNGITGITKILPDIGIHAKRIEIDGLQIINGAQTVYSIYQAYKNATQIEKKSMDAYAKIALRLIGSSDEEFNLQITRYTNFQNPMTERDFWANDDVQERLQNESFSTDIWYEKRRGEFQLTEEQIKSLGVKIVSNKILALSYTSFHLQNPVYSAVRTNDFFTSYKDSKNGIYEYIFNDKTHFKDMYVSFFILNILLDILSKSTHKDTLIIPNLIDIIFIILAISNIFMNKYYSIKFNNNLNLNNYLFEVSLFKKDNDILNIQKILSYSIKYIYGKLQDVSHDKSLDKLEKLILDINYYNEIKESIEIDNFDISTIDSISLFNLGHIKNKEILNILNFV